MNAEPKRRRKIQFSLRTIFLSVTMLAGFIAYYVNWIHRRQEFLAAEASAIQEQMTSEPGNSIGPGIEFDVAAPGLLWLFGEQGYCNVEVCCGEQDFESGQTPFAIQRCSLAERLFPEADVMVFSHARPKGIGIGTYTSKSFGYHQLR